MNADEYMIVQSDILKCLKPEEMDASLKPVCLSGTREDMLQTISDWIMNVDGEEPNVLWLHGLAGSGKSTIAATVADQFRTAPSQRLGAFVFFERGKTVQGSFIRTIAAQLANSDPTLRSHISASIKEHGEDVVQSLLDLPIPHFLPHHPLPS